MELYLNYIEEFGLDKKQKYKKLSKGMKTRTQLAFALSHNAKLFLFDESTAGLDKHFREKFLKLCTDLVADGEKSILIATHITEELDRIADYIAYMQKGRMLFYTESYKMCVSVSGLLLVRIISVTLYRMKRLYIRKRALTAQVPW